MTQQNTLSRARRAVMAMLTALVMLTTTLIVVPPPTAQAQTEVTIMRIQGPGHLSPFVGQSVITEGLVIAVAFNGFYMQDLSLIHI